MRLRWVSVPDNPGLLDSFGVASLGKQSDRTRFVLFRPKREKYKVFEIAGGEALGAKDLKDVVDSAVFEGAQLPERLKKPLPKTIKNSRDEL